MTDATEAEPTDFHSSYISWREFLVRRNLIPLAMVSFAVWLHAGDSLVVATMMPSMVGDVGGESVVSWSVSLYQLSSIVAGAASALLITRYGLRNAMALAALVFAVGCLVSAVGLTMPMVLAGRLVQGFGGGGLVAMAFVGVSLFFEPRYRARAIAVISTLWGCAAILGPVIGSVFVAYANWRWGFAFFAVKALILAMWIAFPDRDGRMKYAIGAAAFPFRRLALLALSVVLISFAGVEIAVERTAPLCVLGLLVLYQFLHMDQSAGDTRLFPSDLLHIQTPIGAGLIMCLFMSFSTVGLASFGPLLLAALYQVSPLEIGYVIAAGSIGWSIFAVITSGITTAYQNRMIRIGMVTIAASVLGLAYAIPSGPLWLVALISFAEGAGFGMCWHFILGRMTSMTPDTEVQRLSGALPTVQRMGYALGAAFVGIVANASGILNLDIPDQASNAAFWIFFSNVPFLLVGLYATMIFTKNRV